MLSAGGLGGFTLSQDSSVGLLVQRIVGRHDVLGRTAPKLTIAGKVPLGTFRKGRHAVRWHFSVNRHPLQRGCYVITFRALTRSGQVRDLSTPYTVAIHANDGPLVSSGIRLRSCGVFSPDGSAIFPPVPTDQYHEPPDELDPEPARSRA